MNTRKIENKNIEEHMCTSATFCTKKKLMLNLGVKMHSRKT